MAVPGFFLEAVWVVEVTRFWVLLLCLGWGCVRDGVLDVSSFGRRRMKCVTFLSYGGPKGHFSRKEVLLGPCRLASVFVFFDAKLLHIAEQGSSVDACVFGCFCNAPLKLGCGR